MVDSLVDMQRLIFLFAVVVFIAFFSTAEVYLIKAFPGFVRLFKNAALFATLAGIGIGIFILVFTFMNVAEG